MFCPICNVGKLKKGKVKEEMYGVFLGEFPAQLCGHCGESFTDSATTKKIEDIAKKKGLFDLAKKTKVTRTGNSLGVRIPKQIINHLKLKEGKEMFIHPEKDRIIIDII